MEENKEILTGENKVLPTEDNKALPADDNNALPVDDNKALLAQIRDMQKKSLMWKQISAIGVLGIFAAISISMIILIPIVMKAVTTATNTLEHIDSIVTQADETLDDVNAMVSEMTTASTNLNKLVDDNAQELTDAVNNIANIDFEGLNDAINDLKNTVGPMASFFSKFR